ncbi:MAG: hypothetical protein KAK00_03195 [Nanoarchaeota archaeon]|nr:hypothetical protein [Nanoarchaeota archaeon]
MFWTIVGMLIVLFSCICIGTVYNKTVKGGKLESVSVYVTLIALAALSSTVTIPYFNENKIIRFELESKNWPDDVKIIGVKRNGKKVGFNEYKIDEKTLILFNSDSMEDVCKQPGEDKESLKKIKNLEAATEDEK